MKLILGTVQFGLNYGINNPTGKPSKNSVKQILDYAFEQGIKNLDTADVYGNAPEQIGQYIGANGQKFKINTKFIVTKEPITNQLKKSLSRLNVSTIDTYFYHSFDEFKNNPKILCELLELKNSHLISKIGLSIYCNDEFKIANQTPEIDVIQFPFNLFDNTQQRGDLISEAKSKGKQLQIRSVFLQGLFFKNPENLPLKLHPLKPDLLYLKNLSKKHGIEIDHLALRYALQQKEIDFVIIGVDNLNQLQRNIKLAEMLIDPEIIQAINQIKITEPKLLYPQNWD